MTTTPISVPEYGVVRIDADSILKGGRLNVYPAIDGKDLFVLRVSRSGVDIQARGFVGIIPLNDDLVLHVTPRVPLGNLARLLSTVHHTLTELPGLLRSYDSEPGIYPSLISIYAASLRASIETLHQQGLMRRYERREMDYTTPRGRINIGRTVQTALPRGLPTVSTTYFERTTDIPENRALLGAVMWLARYASRYEDTLSIRETRQIRHDLNASHLLLSSITHDTSRAFLRDPVVTGSRPLPSLRPDYRPALDLAVSILGEQALIIDQHGKRLQMPSLLINLDVLFEDYIREVLRRAAGTGDWPCAVLDGNKNPPIGAKSKIFPGVSDELVETSPDVVCRHRQTGSFPVIVEVKYKPVRNRVDRTHLEQVLAYGLAYRAQHAVIVQPQGHSPAHRGLRTLGTVGGITCHLYSIDLDGDLTHEEATFSTAIRLLIS